MAKKSRAPFRLWSRLHFFIRFLGLTGLLAAGFGVAASFLEGVLNRWQLLTGLNEQNLQTDYDFARETIIGERGELGVRIAVTLLLAGLALALFALLLELLIGLFFVAGRRSVFGINAFLQIALAAALLVGVNVYSYRHYLRYDWTSAHQFTLPEDIRGQLAQLQGETTIVVYQRHKTFGQLTDKPDAYDYAAERKVVEKVKDLVDQFREFGPQFRVVVLDVEEEGYNDKLAKLTQDNDELRKAIDSAPENSIFFAAKDDLGRGKVQRLSFNDFYQLDKTASQEANSKQGNLVLLYQGIQPFANKVLNIDEKRPKIGIAVIHEWLTSEGPVEYGMPGLRKALTARGFDVRDVVLKKWSQFGPPEPAVYSYEESKLDRLEERLAILDASIKALEETQAEYRKVRDLWKTAKLEELTKKYADQLRGRKVTEEMRQAQLEDIDDELTGIDVALTFNRKKREAAATDRGKLNVDTLAEQRRIADLKAKMERAVADCDLLIVPRMTLRNVTIGDAIPNYIYRLEEAQVEAVRDFLKSGKPVLALFGPPNESPDRQTPPTRGPDALEDLFVKLGIKFGKQTVLFDVESESFAERRTGLLIAGSDVEVPPVEFEWRAGAGRPLGRAIATASLKPNPIRQSMQLVSRSMGRDRPLDLRIRHPRPVYYEAANGQKPTFEPDILMTSGASWNDEQPFPTGDRTPQYERPKPNDPNKGTLEEKRRGPFPIGVAVEEALPADWFADKQTPPVVRVAAIGSGGLFVGPDLSPAKEKLALYTCNWLLGRDDLLPSAEQAWSYPRVSLGEREHTLWNWGAWLLFPSLFLYLGLVVLLVRRLR
jgi:hypothetical protein